jgi:hypothetical protein
MNRLIGKTIKSIDIVGDYDLYGDDERVTSVTKITCTDGTEVYLLGDGGDGDFYCTLYTAQYNTISERFSRGGREFGQWTDSYD